MSNLTLKDEDDFGFSTLHPAKRHHIDNAFNVVAREASIDCGSRPAISSDAPGGFIVEDEEQPQIALSYIPLSAIGAALRHLDLPSDDPEVLQVFRNAASGWGTKGGRMEGIISRDDFRSVCAVLLDNDVDLDFDVGAEAQDDSGSEDVEDEPDDDNDDDYFDPKPSKSRHGGKTVHKRARNHSPKPSKLEDDTPSLTSLQAEECRRAFALFFPDTPFVELDNKKITMEVVTRATRELGVKLKSDEIVEMLEAFSNSADKSMSFADFQKMMVIARMV